jgi:CRISPR-associated protein Csx17
VAHDVQLDGCSPLPLAAYLKALGVLRLVAEQGDSGSQGWWHGDRFVVRSRLDRESLSAFFLDSYRPTSILAPWNGASGFYFREEKLKRVDPATGKRIKTGRRIEPTAATRTVEALAASNSPRLAGYREAISIAKDEIAAARLEEAPREEQKLSLVRRLRGRLPAPAAAWLDAVICLTGEEVRFPPLLGTGGNDGNLDYTNNFMQRLLEIFDPETGRPASPSGQWLRGALFGEAIPGLARCAIGQFSPLSAGGPNASVGFSGSQGTNPWDYVLMLEGALLFGSAATRRLESSGPAALSYPFTSRLTGAGSGASAQVDEGTSHDEIWLPLWGRPAGLPELRALLAEGRATVGCRPARDSLDFTRAIAALGVDRGIESFVRYGFLQRLGRMYLATPLGRIEVRSNPRAELIVDLEDDGFLERVRRLGRRPEAPARIRQLVGRLEAALFELARHGERVHVQETLGLLGILQRVVGRNRSAREAVPTPLPQLSERWVLEADDGSDEFRVAAALAGLHAAALPMRAHLAPIKPGRAADAWDPGSSVAVWGPGPLVPNLLKVLNRRLTATERRQPEGQRAETGAKCFDGFAPADLSAVLAFLAAETDDARIGRLVEGLALVRLPRELSPRNPQADPVPAGLAVLRPFFAPDESLRALGILPSGEARLPLPRRLVALLAAGRLDEALLIAWRRLRLAGVRLPPFPREPPSGGPVDARRLLAALLVPLGPSALVALVRRLLAPDENRRTRGYSVSRSMTQGESP